MFCSGHVLLAVFSPYDSICGISLLLFVLYHPRFLPIDFPWWKLVSSEHTFFSLLFFQKDHENVEAPFYYLAKEFHNLYKEKVEQMKTLTQDFHFRRVLSLMRGEVDLFIAQLLLSVLENRSVYLSSTQGTYIRVQLLEDISAQSLKVSLFIIVIFSCKILASSSLCLVFKHSGDVCSNHSTQSMRTDS